MRRAAAALFLAALALAALLPPASAQAPPPAGKGLTFVAQTPWVAAGGEFNLRVHVDRPPGLTGLELALTVYPAVATRSEFDQTVADKMSGSPLVPTVTVPVGALRAESNGDSVATLAVQDASLPRDPARIKLPPRDGVYPVRVELRDRGAGSVVDRFVTHLLYTPELHSTPKLGMALVLTVGNGPGLQPDANRTLPTADALVNAAQGLDALRSVPFSLAPTPETLVALGTATDARAKALLTALRATAADRQLLTRTYVPTNPAALVGAGLEAEVGGQLNRGTSATVDTLGARPESRTWLADEELDAASLDALVARGFDRVVVREDSLVDLPDLRLTPTRPFTLTSKASRVQAVSLDAGLAAHFDNGRNQGLAAYQLLADLAVVYLDRPGDDQRRGVVAVAPRGWQPNRQFLETMAAGLALSPIVEAVPLDALFSSVPPSRDDTGAPLVRRTAPAAAGVLTDVAADIRTTRHRLDSLGTVLGAGNATSLALDEYLLLAESADLRTRRQRELYIEHAQAGISDQLDGIQMPTGRSITLTGRRAEIPVTFQNRTGHPVKVVVRVQSDKLDFPRGTVETLDLTRQNTTERFPVVARTSGAFPVRITLESPDGNLVVGRTRLTVRSTAATGVSLGIALGAAVFLAVWWGRHALRGRRARGLVEVVE